VGGLVEFGQRGAHDHGDRVPAMGAQPARGDAGLQAEFEAVVAALGATALVARLGQGAIGQVPTRAHRGGDRLQVGAGFRVDVGGQPRHPVTALGAQVQAAPAGPVGLVVVAVGVDDRIDMQRHGRHDLGIVFGGLAHQAALHLVAISRRYHRGQHIDGPADHPQMILTDLTSLNSVRDMRQLRRQRWTSQLPSRPDTGRGLHAAFDLPRRDPQPRGQAVHHRRDHRGLIGWVRDFAEHPIQNIRYISPRLVRSWVSKRSASSVRNSLPTSSLDNVRISV
jgi:hypothetical protein